MGKQGEVEQSNRSSGLRPFHGVAGVVTIALAAVVAFEAFRFVVGTLAFVVKFLIVVAIVVGVARFLFGRSRR